MKASFPRIDVYAPYIFFAYSVGTWGPLLLFNMVELARARVRARGQG